MQPTEHLQTQYLDEKIGRFTLLAFLILLPLTGWAQQNRLVNTHNWRYEYINRMQQRGAGICYG